MSNKNVHLMFGVGAVALAVLLVLTVEWIWGYFAKPPELGVYGIGLGLASIATLLAFKNRALFQGAEEVIGELEKVAWPSRKETSVNTVVVLVTVTVAALILSAFDGIWSFVTARIL
jgi:preprotein translocase SecE subunit